LAAQPLTVQQMGTPEFYADASAAKAVDRLAVEGLGVVTFGNQCLRAGLDAERPVSATSTGGCREPLEGPGRLLEGPASCRRLNDLGYRPVGDQTRGRALTRRLRRGQRVGIPPEAVA